MQHSQLLLLLLLPAAAAGLPSCPLLGEDGCCGTACIQSTCEALQYFGRALGLRTWRHSTGWQDMPASSAPAAACQAYLAGSMEETAASPPYCSWYGIGCNATAYSSTCTTSGAAAHGIRSVELTNNDVSGRVDDPSFLQAVKQLHDCGLKELVVGGSSFGVRGCAAEVQQAPAAAQLQHACSAMENAG
jgi:hypothetical protein